MLHKYIFENKFYIINSNSIDDNYAIIQYLRCNMCYGCVYLCICVLYMLRARALCLRSDIYSCKILLVRLKTSFILVMPLYLNNIHYFLYIADYPIQHRALQQHCGNVLCWGVISCIISVYIYIEWKNF